MSRTITLREFAHVIHQSVVAVAPPDLTYQSYPVSEVLSVEEIRREFSSTSFGSLYLKLPRGWSVEPEISIHLKEGVPQFEVKTSGTGRSLGAARALASGVAALVELGCLIEARVNGRTVVENEDADEQADVDDPAYRRFSTEELQAAGPSTTLVTPTGETFYRQPEPEHPAFPWITTTSAFRQPGQRDEFKRPARHCAHDDVIEFRVRVLRTELPRRRLYV